MSTGCLFHFISPPYALSPQATCKHKFPEYHQTGPPPGRIDQSQTPKFCCLLSKLALRPDESELGVKLLPCRAASMALATAIPHCMDTSMHRRSSLLVCSMIHEVVLTQPCVNISKLMLCLQLDDGTNTRCHLEMHCMGYFDYQSPATAASTASTLWRLTVHCTALSSLMVLRIRPSTPTDH